MYPELRFDIAKVQRIFADPKKTAPLRKQLLIDMRFWKIQAGGKNLPQLLADKCWSAFEELSASSKDAKLKSLRQYPEIMKYAMADEVMRQVMRRNLCKSISPAGVDESVSVADHLTIDTFMPICYNYLTKARKEDALCSTF